MKFFKTLITMTSKFYLTKKGIFDFKYLHLKKNSSFSFSLTRRKSFVKFTLMQQTSSMEKFLKTNILQNSFEITISINSIVIHCPVQAETLWMTCYHINRICWHWYFCSGNNVLSSYRYSKSPLCTSCAWFLFFGWHQLW